MKKPVTPFVSLEPLYPLSDVGAASPPWWVRATLDNRPWAAVFRIHVNGRDYYASRYDWGVALARGLDRSALHYVTARGPKDLPRVMRKCDYELAAAALALTS